MKRSIVMNSSPRRYPSIIKTILTAIILVLFTFAGPGWSPSAAQAIEGGRILQDFSWVYANWDSDSLFLSLSNVPPGEYEIYELESPPRIVIDIPGWTCDGEEIQYAEYDFDDIGLLTQLRATCSDERTRVVLESKYPLYWEQVSDPERSGIELLCYLRFRQTLEELEVDDGTIYLARRYVSPTGQRLIHAVICDPSRSRLTPRVVLASDVTYDRLATVNQIVSGSRAAAGINGGYFMWPGISLSLVIQNGVITAPPFLHRPAFIVYENGSAGIAYLEINATVSSSYGVEYVSDVVNQAPSHGQIALLTPGHPSRIRDDMPGLKAVILNGVVEGVVEDEIEDFSDRHILWSRRQYPPLGLLSVGETLEIDLEVDPDWPDISWAIQGGPFLCYNGQIYISSEEDDFGNDIVRGRSARTAVGVDQRGRLYFVVVEGPNSSRSIGSTLEELAWTMLDLGATNAMNLDGGSSTSMALGFVSPETGIPRGSRGVATALILIDESGRMQGEQFAF